MKKSHTIDKKPSVVANREQFIDFPRHHSRHGTHAWRCLQTACETRKEWRDEQEGISVCGMSCGHVVYIHTHFCNTPAWKFNSFLSIVKISQYFPKWEIYRNWKWKRKSWDWQCETYMPINCEFDRDGEVRDLGLSENWIFLKMYIVC